MNEVGHHTCTQIRPCSVEGAQPGGVGAVLSRRARAHRSGALLQLDGVLFARDNHHDLALLEIGAQAASPMKRQVGLYHLAFKAGDSLDELRACRDHLAAHGVTVDGQADHRVSQALYCYDPDGIMIEVYVDADPAIWRDDPGAVAHVGMLKL